MEAETSPTYTPPTYTLHDIFRAFTDGYHMDGRQFAKLIKDCGLLDKKLTVTDVDLIFAKVKDRSSRRIVYLQFKDALTQIASKKGVPKSDIVKQIEMCGGPCFQGTKADYVKF